MQRPVLSINSPFALGSRKLGACCCGLHYLAEGALGGRAALHSWPRVAVVGAGFEAGSRARTRCRDSGCTGSGLGRRSSGTRAPELRTCPAAPAPAAFAAAHAAPSGAPNSAQHPPSLARARDHPQAMSEDICKRMLRKYDIRQKLGKGVRTPAQPLHATRGPGRRVGWHRARGAAKSERTPTQACMSCSGALGRSERVHARMRLLAVRLHVAGR